MLPATLDLLSFQKCSDGESENTGWICTLIIIVLLEMTVTSNMAVETSILSSTSTRRNNPTAEQHSSSDREYRLPQTSNIISH